MNMHSTTTCLYSETNTQLAFNLMYSLTETSVTLWYLRIHNVKHMNPPLVIHQEQQDTSNKYQPAEERNQI